MEVIVVPAIKIVNSKGDKEEKSVSFGIILTINLRSMNAYANGADASRIDEDVKNVASFIKTLAIITTIHHCVVLIFILTLGAVDNVVPTSLVRYWESTEFLLKPSQGHFYWTMGCTIALGIFSLILLLYRAQHIAAIEDESSL